MSPVLLSVNLLSECELGPEEASRHKQLYGSGPRTRDHRHSNVPPQHWTKWPRTPPSTDWRLKDMMSRLLNEEIIIMDRFYMFDLFTYTLFVPVVLIVWRGMKPNTWKWWSGCASSALSVYEGICVIISFLPACFGLIVELQPALVAPPWLFSLTQVKCCRKWCHTIASTWERPATATHDSSGQTPELLTNDVMATF